MKTFDAKRIRQAEAVQLIILHSIFSRKESRDIIFQGGTALRWFYGGLRFSEDLDFVTLLSREQTGALADIVSGPIRRQFTGNFGSGEFSLKERRARQTAYRAFFEHAPAAIRGKVSVKIEFETLKPAMKPRFDRVILQSVPPVARFLQEGTLKTFLSPIIVNVETPEEILTDKIRALMERPYTKGRDFFDIWFITGTLGVKADIQSLKTKLDMYEVPFSISTPPSFYANMETLGAQQRMDLTREIADDLSRFIGADTLTMFQETGFHSILQAVQDTFRGVVNAQDIDFSRYQRRNRNELL